MNSSPRDFYTQRIDELDKAIASARKQMRWLAFTRLIVFLMLFPSVFLLIPKFLIAGIISTVVLLVIFLWLIKRYLKKEEGYKHLKALRTLNQQEIQALNYNYSAFKDGTEFIDTEHPFSYDMDIFGEGSIFQYINRTVSFRAKSLLARWLSRETLDTVKISQRQTAIKELAIMPELVQDFCAAGSLNSDSELDIVKLEEWVSQPAEYLTRPFLIFLTKILPPVTILSVGLVFFIPVFQGILPALYLLQLFLVGSRFSNTSRQHEAISKRFETLSKYHKLITAIERGNFVSHELTDIHKALVADDRSASRSLRTLTKIISAFDSRLNIIAAIFLEGFLLWDFQCMIRLERWKESQGNQLSKWIEALSRFDAFSSLATFAFNNPDFHYPVTSDTVVLEASEMGHLLIPPEQRVCNDFTIQQEGDFILVTGANMAGKSTFLRTVASNMILAMAGAPVCANALSFKPMAMFSSMRTSDSLNKHESYFYAELKRLKDLLDRLKTGDKLFIILDEILKGTNSTDKQKGSRAAMEQILDLGGTGIIATHDLQLASIEEQYPSRVKNICFEIEIDQAKISFDYKLKDGVTTKMNAMLLMEQMGIIRSGDADQN